MISLNQSNQKKIKKSPSSSLSISSSLSSSSASPLSELHQTFNSQSKHLLSTEPGRSSSSSKFNPKSSRIRRTSLVVGLFGLFIFFSAAFLLWTSSSSSQSIISSLESSKLNFLSNNQKNRFFEYLRPKNDGRVFELNELPQTLAPAESICSFCDCKSNRTHPNLIGFSNHTNLSNENELSRSAMAAHVWKSIRDIYCLHAWLGEGQALDLLLATDLSRDISSHVQWRLDPLKPNVPTAYIFTKTSWAGKTKHLRYAFFKRHILTIRTHLAIVKKSKWPEDGPHSRWGQNRQLVWIIIEDGEKLANDVAQELANSDLPYIYFTYGPTHHFGNAQQNAAYSLIHRLSDRSRGGFLGHGPIMSIDDDSNILPELLVLIWRTKRIGLWPMGNLGPHGWEGPFFDENHKLIRWEAGAVKDRKFPIDNGAFAFMSDLLGDIIRGPKYWPTDISGGENEFISKIVKTKEEIEPLCYNCHVAWHNEPLPSACTVLQLCP